MSKSGKILHSLQDLKVEDLEVSPKITPGDTLVKPLKGKMKGKLGLVIKQREDERYKVGFFKGEWEDIKNTPVDRLDAVTRLFYDRGLEVIYKAKGGG